MNEHAFEMPDTRALDDEHALQGMSLDEPTSMGPEPTGAFAPDTVLDGTYRIVRRLAQGGMGEVYLAAHERLPGFFAIKALQAALALHGEFLSRFRREAEIMAGLRHPNVVQVFDFNVSPTGVPYLVMELLEGPDLATEVREGSPLSPAAVMSIVRQVASALAAVHAVGVVHRDLKPANIMLIPVPGQPPMVKVIDFGISISGGAPHLTTDRSVMGTPEFMSPEQALGLRNEIDARSDQFALAALAHTLLAKRPPFSGDTPLATMSAIVNGRPEPLAPHVSWPSAEVERVLLKGMARDREDRFPTVLAFADALEAALTKAMAAPLRRRSRRPSMVPIAAALVLLVLSGGLTAARAARPLIVEQGMADATSAIRDGWLKIGGAVSRSVRRAADRLSNRSWR